MSKKSGNWVQSLVESTGKNINLETVDGVIRGGKISGFTFRKFYFNDREQQFPIEVELNGDPNDRVNVDRILRMVIG